MLLGALGGSSLGNILAGRRINRPRKGRGQGRNIAGKGVLRASYGNIKMDF